ncbi:hypothetical protein LSUCC0031_14505 [Rhodobacterales bacterium LSUCC0031]|nr:hypothetical protein [Rhodobacterales bacterium LSUCC0031]
MLGATGMVRGGAPLVVSAGDIAPISRVFIVEASSLAAAEALAAFAPAVAWGGSVNLVAHLAMPAMAH